MEEKTNKEDLKKIKSYIKMYEQNTITKDQLKEFCTLMVNYCHARRHADCSIAVPSVEFGKLDPTICAFYHNDNYVKINEVFLDNVHSKNGASISDLINTIGHEMEHYEQNSKLMDYDSMTAEEQSVVDKKSKTIVDAYKNYFKLNKEDVETLCRMLAPYRLRSYTSDKNFTPPAEFCATISYSSYYTILSEIDARKEGVAFSLDLMSELEKSGAEKSIFSRVFDRFKKDKSKDFNSILDKEKNNQNNVKENEEGYTELAKKKMDSIQNSFSANEKTILDIARRVESYGGDLGHLNDGHYINALRYLIKTKTLEEKKDLLKNAIFNGYSGIIGVLTDSISNDIDFKKNKEDISNFTMNCLTERSHREENVNVFLDNYDFQSKNALFADYSKIMTPKQFEQLIGETLKKNVLDAQSLLTCSGYKDFSVETILSYQNTAKSLGEEGKEFSRQVLIRSNMQKNIKLLESGKLERTNFEIIKNLTKVDFGYNQYAEKLEGLFQDNEKRISKSEHSNLGNSNAQDRKIMGLYSKYMLQYYDDKSQNNSENKNNSEFRKVNDKMLKYLKLKEAKVEDNLEMSYNDISLIEANFFTDDDINKLRSNKSAMRKLAYILGSGVYVSNGMKIDLTTSQQMGLAKLLAKVNERDLKEVKASKTSQIAKQLTETTQKVIDGAENSL